jgi:hypothetical protein
MDATWMAKQMVDFQKTTFDNSYNALVMLQDHTEKVATTIFEQATWVPEESRRILSQWSETYKKSRDDMKLAADENFSKVAEMLSLKND